MDFTPLISAYSSFFELTVAFNFAYAASQNFRDIVKGGFLSDARKLSDRIESKGKDLDALVVVLQDSGDINEKHRNAIDGKIRDNNYKIKKYSIEIQHLIDRAQEKVSDQLKSFYIVIGIYGLFVLFLSGQEQIHNFFPSRELWSSTILVSLLLIILILLTFFTSIVIPIIYLSFYMMLSIAFSISPYSGLTTFFYDFSTICSNKYLVNFTILLCIMPFAFAYIRYMFNASRIYVPYWVKFLKIEISILEIEKNLKNYQSSNKYLKELSL